LALAGQLRGQSGWFRIGGNRLFPALQVASRRKTRRVAGDVIYTGNFAKGNVVSDVLRSWFGAEAGQPGTAQYIEMVPGKPHWHMRPVSPATSTAVDADVS
jgi:hypothetical protein